MTLIATGDVLRNRALQGFEYMSQEEAEREALRQQIKQAESAQKAQLAGTGLGIAGAAGVRHYGDKIKSGLSSIFGGGEQASTNLPAVTESVGVVGTPPVGSLEASISNAAVDATSKTMANAAVDATSKTVANAATTAPAGGLTFGAIAAPLAIGIGAYFLLNALFD